MSHFRVLCKQQTLLEELAPPGYKCSWLKHDYLLLIEDTSGQKRIAVLHQKRILLKDILYLQIYSYTHYNRNSSDKIVNNEYFALIEILPPSTQSFAPVTTQYPGGSSGPLTISCVSTKLSIFGVFLGTGGPS